MGWDPRGKPGLPVLQVTEVAELLSANYLTKPTRQRLL